MLNLHQRRVLPDMPYVMKSSEDFYNDYPPPPSEEDLDPNELTDDELQSVYKGKPWVPELVKQMSWRDMQDTSAKHMRSLPPLTPSAFTEFAFFMPADEGSYKNFSFDERRHLRRPYNTPARRVLLFCGRQVEKSTLLGNIAITYSCMVPAYKTLYVSPSATQTRTFSVDRLKEPIDTSPVLKQWTTHMLMQNVFEKQFVNRSKITLRYAFLNADRARGIPAWRLMLDEFQDIIADNVPIIEQCTSHAPKEWIAYTYAGTPKSLDNPIEYVRANLSNQGEWVVPCDRCGTKTTGRHWNILGEKNIGKKGLICDKCGGLINPMHQDADWAPMIAQPNTSAPFESYRIPQLMVPWVKWDEILLNYRRYPREKFYNEVLGMSYDSGLRPLTSNQIKSMCNPDLTMHPDAMEKLRIELQGREIFAGIDWGTGENSYTVLCLGYYEGTKFRIFFIHRFIGEDMDPEPQREKIYTILHAYGVRLIGSDYGGGFDRNDYLLRRFGINRLHKFQYAPRPKKKVNWEPRLRRWIVHRTEVMSDVFNSIKRGLLEFPRWEEFKEPYAQDMLNIFSEFNTTLRMVQYQHRQDKPDDSLHSILLCFLVSMLVHSRPDIIAPAKEWDNVAVFTGWGGILLIRD
jgi:hypothetical protein